MAHILGNYQMSNALQICLTTDYDSTGACVNAWQVNNMPVKFKTLTCSLINNNPIKRRKLQMIVATSSKENPQGMAIVFF
ncbi:hypothetical protein OUZ56_024740 [Daphnia magna]|uniref:Uncharacterized protein n=1 Tax=Daphnia magna TaxID=35525 RepID=A0ABQ9ZHT9_9CRUS|nr:hypothetical protein OUZ56_024740 [Daphnia magna]